MNRIASFCVDHTKLEKGLYVSRIDGDVVTYDLRMCTPNAGIYHLPAAGDLPVHCGLRGGDPRRGGGRVRQFP